MSVKNYAIVTSGTDLFGPGLSLASGEYAITNMIFCNVTTVDVTLDLYICETGKSSGDPETQVINSLVVPAGETFTFDTEKFILSETDVVNAVVSADLSLVGTISYMRVS